VPKRRRPSTDGSEAYSGPAARDEDPFDDDAVTSILDAAWDALQF